jgi:hypothetical protein
MTNVKGIELDVNYAEELEPYLNQFDKWKIRENKLQSCSPFRDEIRPSFAVNLDTGLWVDSGAVDQAWYKGNFVALLSFLREESWQDTEAYLLEKYYATPVETDGLKLDLNLSVERTTYKIYSKEYMKKYMFRHPYLGNRGISEKIQRAFRIGYDKEAGAVAIPWADKDGNIINIKFRRTNFKFFYYEPDGQPIKQHIYGLHFVIRHGFKEVVCTESETDCMYLWSNGIPAIAFGGASMSAKQEELLLSSTIETLVIGTDTDIAGERFADNLVERLGGKLSLKRFQIPEGLKDINQIPVSQLMGRYKEAITVTFNFLKAK